MLLPLFFAVRAAHAADVPAFWFRQSLAAAAFPTGALSETRLQVRTPIFRSDSIVFQDTYAGAGLRLDTSPAFVDPGVQVSLAPVDVFDVDLSAELLGYLPGPFGLVPYAAIGTKLGGGHDETAHHISALGWALDAAPTLKMKVGPVIAFDALAVSWIHIPPPAGTSETFVYEPLRDLIVRWDDVCIEHQPGILYEIADGKEKPMLDVGATWRDRVALGSGDRSGILGVLLVGRPAAEGEKPAIPTIIGMATLYLIDQDRVGTAPYLGIQANWILEPPLRRTP